MLKVSIITAVRNGVDEIKSTMDSVGSQSYRNIEYVIIDGASTDGTAEYINSRRQDAAVFQSEKDDGVYDAFNRGLLIATGDVVGFLNAGDTFAHADAVARIMEPLNSGAAEAVFGDVAITDNKDDTRTRRLYRSQLFRPARARFGFMPAHPTLYMKRDIYSACGEYDPTFRIAGDFELTLRVFVKRPTRYRYLPETLVRMPVGGLSNRGWRSKWIITTEMKRACAMNGIRTNLLYLSARLPFKLLELVGLWR